MYLFVDQIVDRRGDARMATPAGEQHSGAVGVGIGSSSLPRIPAIAVVDASLVHGPIEDHGDAFLDARGAGRGTAPAQANSAQAVGSTQEKLFSAHASRELEVDVVQVVLVAGIGHRPLTLKRKAAVVRGRAVSP